MLLDDAFDVLRRRVSVPGAFRVDEHDRAFPADAKTVRARAQDTARHVREANFTQALLEVIPGSLADFLRRAVAMRAEEDMAPRAAERDLLDRRLDRRSFRVLARHQMAASSISLVRI